MAKARASKMPAEHIDVSKSAPMRLASAWMADWAKAKYGVAASIAAIKAGGAPTTDASARPAKADGKP